MDFSQVITVAQKQQQAHEQALAMWRIARDEAIANITVTVDGMIFNGDEAHQQRMGCAIVAAANMNTTYSWILTNGTHVSVTAAQLKQALRLAVIERIALWNTTQP